MTTYDNASWHYDGDFPEGLSQENGAIHIGMFFTWCIDNSLLSEEEHLSDNFDDIEKVKNRSMTGRDFFLKNCDEKFWSADLNELGNKFAVDYYEEDTDFGRQYASYLEDYSEIFEINGTIYSTEDSWDNYYILQKKIDQRFIEWKKYRNIEV